jgi:hypothetical protein
MISLEVVILFFVFLILLAALVWIMLTVFRR